MSTRLCEDGQSEEVGHAEEGGGGGLWSVSVRGRCGSLFVLCVAGALSPSASRWRFAVRSVVGMDDDSSQPGQHETSSQYYMTRDGSV